MDKFPSASFKKFASEKDAWAFIRGVELSSPPEVKGTLLLTDLKLLEMNTPRLRLSVPDSVLHGCVFTQLASFCPRQCFLLHTFTDMGLVEVKAEFCVPSSLS